MNHWGEAQYVLFTQKFERLERFPKAFTNEIGGPWSQSEHDSLRGENCLVGFVTETIFFVFLVSYRFSLCCISIQFRQTSPGGTAPSGGSRRSAAWDRCPGAAGGQDPKRTCGQPTGRPWSEPFAHWTDRNPPPFGTGRDGVSGPWAISVWPRTMLMHTL